MESDQLPDLSNWQYIEVWTIEESAMLWAAIDPTDHLNLRLDYLRGRVSDAQYKKAWTMQRALSEAVCGGTLPFVEAWEMHDDDQYGAWQKQINYPELPNHNTFIPHMTRLKQAAVRKWADSKKILSWRQTLRRESKKPVQTIEATCADKIVFPAGSSVQLLSLPAPSYLDSEHPRYSPKLGAAIRAWEAFPEPARGKTPKQGLVEYLTENCVELGLSNPDGSPIKLAIEEVAKVANWNQKGGAPKTPG